MRFVIAVLSGCDVGLWAIMALHHPISAVGQRRAWADTKLSDAAAHSVAAYSNYVLGVGPTDDYMPTWG